jgi:diguanylate cyclase (GGDEF)-like protein
LNSTWNWRQAILGKIDREYREAYLREDKTQIQIIIAITGIWVFGYIYVEFQVLSSDPRFYILLALRLLFSSLSIWLFFKLPRMHNLDNVDVAVLGWSIAGFLLVSISNLSMDDIHIQRININLAWVLACYLFPTRQLYKSIPALLVSILSIYVLFSYRALHPQDLTLSVFLAKAGGILAMNIFGFVIALRLDSQRYHQYLIQKTLSEGQAKLKELATSDSLTGIFNRRSFLEIASAEFDRYHRYGEKFSFAIIDLDKLKELNDTYGHPAGDHALLLLTETIKLQKRSSDTVGRLAGDEFGLILPNTNADNALDVLARVKNTLAETIVEAPNHQQFQVRFSAGISEINETDENFDAIYRRADRALLAAKQAGRNRIEKT